MLERAAGGREQPVLRTQHAQATDLPVPPAELTPIMMSAPTGASEAEVQALVEQALRRCLPPPSQLVRAEARRLQGCRRRELATCASTRLHAVSAGLARNQSR